MIIHVEERDLPYAQIERACLEDHRLSWKARGLLAYLLSKPHSWEVHRDQLVQASEKDGRAAVQGALQELVNLGYAKLGAVRGDKGRVQGKYYVVAERPRFIVPSTDDRRTTFPSVGENRRTVSPTTVKPSDGKPVRLVKKEGESKTQEESEKEEENSLTPFESFPGAVNGVHAQGSSNGVREVALPAPAKKKLPAAISDEDWPGLTALIIDFGFPLEYLNNNNWWNAVSHACNGLDMALLDREFGKIEAYFTENPRKRPASSAGWKRFVRGWLQRAAENERRYHGLAQKAPRRY